jgi:hypothetical protein
MIRVSTAALVLALTTLLVTGCRTGPDATTTESFSSLPSPAADGSMAPHLALTPAGDVVMSWLEPAGDGGHALKLATLGGEAWSPSSTLTSASDWFINWADFPSVTPITAKDWVAHWLVKQPGGTYSYDIALAISRDAGATWGAPLTPHDDGTPTEHGFATLFPWGDGFGAVWLDGRKTKPEPGGMTVRYARLGFDGVIRESGEIDELACDCCATDVALATAGPVATYRDRTADEIRDIAVSRYADGAWQPPVIVGNDQWQIAGCPVNGSTIAARGERVVVAWYTAPNRQRRVQLAWSDDGGRTFGAPVLIEEGAVSGNVDVDLLTDDLAVVSWTAKSGEGPGEIRLRRVPFAGEPGPVQLVARSAVGRGSGFPQMIHGRDRLVYAWPEAGDPAKIHTAWSPLK